jgi:hypothetical protein
MRTAYDLSHVKSVKAWGLLYKGKMAGRMVANYSDNPMGSVCTATVSVWAGPLKPQELYAGKGTGTAGGGGYDKLSAAVYEAIEKMGFAPRKLSHGNGETVTEFEAWGYTVIEVL